MKLSSPVLLLIAWEASNASAFPNYLSEALAKLRGFDSHGAQARQHPQGPSVKDAGPGIKPPFDPELQYVDTHGRHEFVPPGPKDHRGPCPGLNAMANHGYLPHNGIITVSEAIASSLEVFGMGDDLSDLLATLAAVFDGDLHSFSIGSPARSLSGHAGLLGEPNGLAGGHNRVETDVSPVFGDLYEYGSITPRPPQFAALYKLGLENGDSVDLDVMTQHRVRRFQQSVSENPYMFLEPFENTFVSGGAHTFVYRFMANKSAEHPMGLLDGATLESFYAMRGEYPNFVSSVGHERIPDNWYRRHPNDTYGLTYLVEDLQPLWTKYPQFLAVGGNRGEVDSFVAVDPADLTGGVYNAQTLAHGNNAVCFAMQSLVDTAPDILAGLYRNITTPLGLLQQVTGSALKGASCPELTTINQRPLQQFPGNTKLKKNGMY